MGDRILRWIGILAILALAALGGYLLWPRPPHPPVPVPTLDMAQAGFQARLLPVGSGLAPLTAQVTGRSAAGHAPGSQRHEWPGFHAAARFEGQAVTLRFDDAVNRWRVTLDGEPILISRPGWQDLQISGLTTGPHLVTAEKISESQAPAVFDGFFLDAATSPCPRPSRPPG